MASTDDYTAVAFIGNSYIYFNDLPAQIQGLLESAQKVIEIGQVTPGGQTLSGHSTDDEVAALLCKSPPWTHIIMQDNSRIPGDEAARVASENVLREHFGPALNRVGATVVLYSTWGHRDGCVGMDGTPSLRDIYPTFEVMLEKLTAGYLRYADILQPFLPDKKVLIAPVGQAFGLVKLDECAAGRDPLNHQSLFYRLYVPDNFHPSRIGTYLAACVFYGVLSGKSPMGLSYIPQGCAHDTRLQKRFGEDWRPEEVSPSTASYLQEVAHRALGTQLWWKKLQEV